MSEDGPRLDLTDAEWMSIIDQDRDGLPPCCGNISALRDSITSHARNGGQPIFYSEFEMLKRHLSWCFPDHDIPSPVFQKIIDQVGWTPPGGHEAEREFILD